MNKTILAFTLFTTLLVSGCVTNDIMNNSEEGDTITKGDFSLEVHSEKSSYNQDEYIDIQASINYLRDDGPIDITHGTTPFLFKIEQLNGDIVLSSFIGKIEKSSKLTNGEPLTEHISGLSPVKGNIDIEDIKGEKVYLPEGDYKVIVETRFTYRDQNYNISLDKKFSVR